MKLSEMPEYTVIEITLTHHPFLNDEDGTPVRHQVQQETGSSHRRPDFERMEIVVDPL